MKDILLPHFAEKVTEALRIFFFFLTFCLPSAFISYQSGLSQTLQLRGEGVYLLASMRVHTCAGKCLGLLCARWLTFIILFLLLGLFIYVFIYGCGASSFLCEGFLQLAASGGHSSSWCAGLSLSRPLLLRSTGSRHAGSVVVAHGPSCSVACGIFPDQGSNPCPLHWQADS